METKEKPELDMEKLAEREERLKELQKELVKSVNTLMDLVESRRVDSEMVDDGINQIKERLKRIGKDAMRFRVLKYLTPEMSVADVGGMDGKDFMDFKFEFFEMMGQLMLLKHLDRFEEKIDDDCELKEVANLIGMDWEEFEYYFRLMLTERDKLIGFMQYQRVGFLVGMVSEIIITMERLSGSTKTMDDKVYFPLTHDQMRERGLLSLLQRREEEEKPFGSDREKTEVKECPKCGKHHRERKCPFCYPEDKSAGGMFV